MRIGPYRFFFNSREETRKHVHVATASGTAKFRLEPVVALESYYDLSPKDLRDIDLLVREHENELRAAWDRHFTS